ncbi:MAG: GntR family transcriptional regulator [Actinomycetota bacterium]|nr:GntR family transcriptional regulator [Actinomycetota bacterium]
MTQLRTIGDGHRTLREQVEDEIRERIVSGAYAPGQRLVEDRIAIELGVSRNPVREALRALSLDGFVVALPRRGAMVRRLSESDVHDLFDVRRSLESLAASLAAQRGASRDGASLRGVLAAAQDAITRGAFDELAALNTDFHEQVVALSGNTMLAVLVRSLAWRTRWIFRQSAATRGPESWTEHLHLVEAIEARDAERAAALAAEHVEAARASALRHLRELDGHRPTA